MEFSDLMNMMGPFMGGEAVPLQEQLAVLRGLGLEIPEAAARELPPERNMILMRVSGHRHRDKSIPLILRCLILRICISPISRAFKPFPRAN